MQTYYAKIYNKKAKISRKDALLKYIKADSTNKKFKRQDRKRTNRYNIVIHAIKIHRECVKRKEAEIEIRSRYTKTAEK